MTRSRLFKLALPAAVALGAGTAVAIAAIPASDGTIHGCYATTAASPTLPGQLRIVDEGVNCAPTEQTLTFNQRGPTGPTGPQGDPGLPGDSGTDTSGGFGGGTSGGTSTSPFDTSQPGGPTADIFLALDGIAGGSTDAKHKDEIAIESFAFLAKRPTTTTKTASTASTATRFSGLRLDKVYDVSSPKLFAAATSGRHIKSATVTFSTSSDPSGTDVLTYKLSDVTVTSYEQGGANPDTKPLGSLEEEVALVAARVQVTEKTFDAKGSPGPVVTASWQVPKAKR
jgi:type VI secretion system secreted protein Hcp